MARRRVTARKGGVTQRMEAFMASLYTAHQPDAQGWVHYTDEEHGTWQILIERQLAALEGKACDEYRAGLARLALPRDRIPQLGEINAALTPATGWSVTAVPALISFDRFFALLRIASFRWPPSSGAGTSSITCRSRHLSRIFGHCAMLTNPAFAHFTHLYGRLGLGASKEEQVFLAQLYWFTVEFGLLQGGGAAYLRRRYPLSSIGETAYALSGKPELQPFDLLEILRTPIASTSCSPSISCCRAWIPSTVWHPSPSWTPSPRPVASACVRPALRPFPASRRANPFPSPRCCNERSPECLNWRVNDARRAAPTPQGERRGAGRVDAPHPRLAAPWWSTASCS